MTNYLNDYQHLVEKWAPILDHKSAGEVSDPYKRSTLAVVLENQEREMQTQDNILSETVHANSVSGGGVENWNPILIGLVRRAMPNLIAYDIAGVQPMTGPTGLIFSMRSRYNNQTGTEALFNEADTDFSGTGVHAGDSSSLVTGENGATDVGAPGAGTSSIDGAGTGDNVADNFAVGDAFSTAFGEDIGDDGAGTLNQMAFSIEKSTVTAKTRALKAEYTMEIAQDLKAIHGLDAEAELANILSAEILAEINREFIRKVNLKAKLGAQTSNVTTAGNFDLSVDADGRWSVEKYRGLYVQLEREANQIAKETRRGKGNVILVSSDVATALNSAGVLDYQPAIKSGNLTVDDTGNTFAGTINGKMKVYIDPYATVDYANVIYRGANAIDAGIFYCPYVPLTMVRAVDPNTFQPKIGFKTRYGLVANPFAEGTAQAQDNEGNNRANTYMRIFRVSNIGT